MKTCIQCGREFQPSSRHKHCPACRRQNGRVLCVCGNPKHFSSSSCNDCCNRKGAGNGNWKGGKRRWKNGYVTCRVPDHPRGPNVFEHILVMEDALGRYLYPGETIHHLNGIRDDNRLENLELWTRPQPSGIRARDALAWAQEILTRYREDVSSWSR